MRAARRSGLVTERIQITSGRSTGHTRRITCWICRLVCIFKQSAICRGSETVSHVRNPSSILPAGTGESGKMTFASEGFIHAAVGWTFHYLFTGTREHVSDCAGGRYTTITERGNCSSAYRRAGNNQHPRQVLPMSFALAWSRRQQRMDYRSIFLSASYGKKVASTRWRSAPRALKALRNSCRQLPIGAGSVIHSM